MSKFQAPNTCFHVAQRRQAWPLRHGHRLCALSAALLALPVALAQAQAPQAQAAPAAATASSTTSIVVTGQRVLSSPLQEERRATGVIDVIEVGDVATQTHTSIADLTRSLPGISTSKDQGRNQTATGESQYATIRGFEAGFNAYTLDGLRLPQTSGNSRAISLNLFSPFAVASIAVDKTPGADRDADAIAGSIDLRTPTAFDSATEFTRVRLLGQGAQQALKHDLKGSGGAVGVDLSRRFGEQRQFGLYVAAYAEQRNSTAEAVAVQNNYQTTRSGVGTARANEDALSADGIQWNFYESEIQRQGLTAALDHRSVDLELRARLNLATYKNRNTMNQVGLRNEVTSGQSRPNNSNYANGVYTPWGVNPANYFRVEDTEQELRSLQLGGTQRLGPWQATLDAAWAQGRLDQPQRIEAAFRGISYIGTANNTGTAVEGVPIDLSNPKSPRAVLTPGAATYVAALSRPNQIYVQRGYDYLEEDKRTLKGELAWKGQGTLERVALGALHETSDRSGRSLSPDDTRYRFRTALQAGTVDGLSVAAFDGQVLGGMLGGTLPRPMKLFSRDLVEQQVAQYVSGTVVPEARLNNGLTDATETRQAVYASGTLRLGDVELVPGLRYEKNSFSARYWLSDADGARFINAGRDSDFTAPSLLAAWRPDTAWVARAALRSSYARPAFDQIAGRTSISRDPSTNQIISISQPNPDLQPLRATSLDLGLDFTAGAGRHLQLALYHKQLKNIVVATATVSTAVDGITYLRPANGREGRATGAEVSGQYTLDAIAGLPGRLGLGGSLTTQKTRAEYLAAGNEVRVSTLPQAPDLLYSARLFYDGDRTRANLQYHWTGRYVTVLQSTQPDVYVQPASELSFSIAHEVAKDIELGLGVRNLLDSHAYWATIGESKRYLANDRNGGYIKTGRVFQLSLTMKL